MTALLLVLHVVSGGLAGRVLPRWCRGAQVAVNTRVGQVIADEWGSERLAQLRIGVHLNRTWHEIDTIGYPPTTPDGIIEPAIAGLLNQRGWAITGPWTNDEWDQWGAPIRRVVRVSNR